MSRKELFVVLPLLFLILWVFAGRAIFAPFNIEDDYHYIKIAKPEITYLKNYENTETYSDFPKLFSKYNAESGRFRPMSVCFLWAFSKLSGGNYHYTGLLIFLFSGFSLLAFYTLLRMFKMPVLISLLFTLLFFTGKHEQIFYRRTGELFGLLFIFSGFILFTRSARNNSAFFNVLSVISFLAASLFKETFTALIPAITGLCVLIYSIEKSISLKESLKRNIKFISVLLVIFCINLFGIFTAFTHKTTYSFEAPLSFSFQNLLSNFLAMSGSALLWIPIVILSVFFIAKRKNISMLIFLFLIGILWFGSQLFAYKETMVSYNRYLVPAGIYPLVLSAFCIPEIKFLFNKKVFYVITISLFLLAINGLKNITINTSYYQARATSYHDMLDTIAKNSSDKNQKLVMLMQEGGLYDFFESTAVFLSNRDLNCPIELYEIRKNGKVKSYPLEKLIIDSDIINETEEQDSAQVFEKIKKDSLVKTIIFSTPEPFDWYKPDGFMKTDFQKISFPEKYFSSSWKNIFNGDSKSASTINYFFLERKAH